MKWWSIRLKKSRGYRLRDYRLRVYRLRDYRLRVYRLRLCSSGISRGKEDATVGY